MKILILANNDVGLYQFRKELIEAMGHQNEIHISLPYGELIEQLTKMGCHYIEVLLLLPVSFQELVFDLV